MHGVQPLLKARPKTKLCRKPASFPFFCLHLFSGVEIEKANLNQACKMQPEYYNDYARNLPEEELMPQKELPQECGRGSQYHKHHGKPQNKSQGVAQKPAPVFGTDSCKICDVSRNKGHDTGRKKRDQPC